MGTSREHARLAKENLNGAKEEYRSDRYSNVGLLALRSLEQMVEACAAVENLHFHQHPRTAHRNRRSWLRSHHAGLVKAWDQLWSIYGALGYGGVNGKRAEQALKVLDEVFRELRIGEKAGLGH
jgi:hypothetical protein